MRRHLGFWIQETLAVLVYALGVWVAGEDRLERRELEEAAGA